jgi:hypothetical protein
VKGEKKPFQAALLLAPIGSLLYRGEIYLPTVATAARTRHVMKRPAVSLTLFRVHDEIELEMMLEQ